MATVWMPTIFGSDTDLDTETPLLTEVLALSDVVSFSKQIEGMYPAPALDDESIEYIDSFRTSAHRFRIGYQVVLMSSQFPSVPTKISDFYHIPVLKKRYHWVQFPDNYNLLPDAIHEARAAGGDRLLAVALDSFGEPETESGTKKWTLTFRERGVYEP